MLNVPCISESGIDIKIKLIFILTLLCRASKGFIEAFKAFTKPFEAPQRSMKIKIERNFFSSSRIGMARINMPFICVLWIIVLPRSI